MAPDNRGGDDQGFGAAPPSSNSGAEPPPGAARPSRQRPENEGPTHRTRAGHHQRTRRAPPKNSQAQKTESRSGAKALRQGRTVQKGRPSQKARAGHDPEQSESKARPTARGKSDDEHFADGGDKNHAGSAGRKGAQASRQRRALFRSPLFKIGIAVVILLLIVAGTLWWLNARQYEDTDDAFIDTHIVHVAPQVAGQVLRVLVNDNETVAEGALLIEINSADAAARLSQVQAQELQAETQYQQALASAEGIRAQAESAQSDLARYRLLQSTSPAAVSQQQIDQASAAARSAAAQRNAALKQAAGAQAQIDVYKAQISAAQLNLGYTKIVAPSAGHVTKRSVAVGDYVSPGQQLLDIVPPQYWVTANFKETQLAHMRTGQPVSVKIDACNTTVDGHVDSIQRGAGQAFGILPPENATGNFVKVVQRVPVKIVFDHMPENCVLGPGMSVEPRVKVR